MTSAPPIAVAFGAATDAGLRRRINEDSFLAVPPLFLVADGMGGHNAGEIASATVIDQFAGLAGRESLTIDDVQAGVVAARRRVAALPPGAGAGAGTTLAGVVIADVEGEGYWLALNLGDSRTYRLSEGHFEQVSVDHSVVQELVDSGQLAADAAHRDSRRNVITRAIGAGSDAEPDYWLIPAEDGDRILVCSDGLSGELEQDAIHGILLAEADPQAAATRLVHEAMVRGGRDNITAIVVDALAVRTRAHRTYERDTVPVSPAAVDDTDDADIDEDTLPRAVFAGGS
ncbi:PP2C family protein-serine/threonine phosphatase [Microbacterium sp. NPDC056044]|uniref:PP2C family protein-serine/threonine phosphatase n=1 Tax=Microbacterium sp. NPDC056044 TaxID=3345690 RepID=UPI0035DEE360